MGLSTYHICTHQHGAVVPGKKLHCLIFPGLLPDADDKKKPGNDRAKQRLKTCYQIFATNMARIFPARVICMSKSHIPANLLVALLALFVGLFLGFLLVAVLGCAAIYDHASPNTPAWLPSPIQPSSRYQERNASIISGSSSNVCDGFAQRAILWSTIVGHAFGSLNSKTAVHHIFTCSLRHVSRFAKLQKSGTNASEVKMHDICAQGPESSICAGDGREPSHMRRNTPPNLSKNQSLKDF